MYILFQLSTFVWQWHFREGNFVLTASIQRQVPTTAQEWVVVVPLVNLTIYRVQSHNFPPLYPGSVLVSVICDMNY